MIDIIFNVIEMLAGLVWGLIRLPVFILACAVVLFVILTFAWFIYHRTHGVAKIEQSNYTYFEKRALYQKLFIDFPRQLALDKARNNPNDFKKKGVVIFTGRQGNGKTIAMTQAIWEDKTLNPECKVITNYAFVGEDEQLDHWRKLIDFKNGPQGVVVGMDETQNWFSSSQSKNFPPEMLQVITQNRKNRRIIYGTAQNFYLLSKAIRSQTTEVRECRTFFGCFTVVRRRVPILNCDGNVEDWHNIGYYCFVHSDELRSHYDTYKVIENLSKSGFQDRPVLTSE